jgi:hypothetical protein
MADDDDKGASNRRGTRKAKPSARAGANAGAKRKAVPKAERRAASRAEPGTKRSQTSPRGSSRKTTRADRPAEPPRPAAKSAVRKPPADDARAAVPPRRSAVAPRSKSRSGKARGPAKPEGVRPSVPRPRAKPARGAAPPDAAAAAAAPSPDALTEEERIESAKYLPSSPRPRVFEEERFLFPESYGVDRVRLHVKDPEWLFAHWDVNPSSVAGLRAELGDRAMALSRLTLRVLDTKNGGESVVLLPPGARSWYVRTAGGRRAYRAELGFTLPSGEFRRLAESNVVVAPRAGPSPEASRAQRTYKQARSVSAAGAADASAAEQAVSTASDRPWSVPPEDAASREESDSTPGQPSPRPGGASDAFRR